jgi:hypothetical protein
MDKKTLSQVMKYLSQKAHSSMSVEQRKERARKAGIARWSKTKVSYPVE